MPSQFDYGRPEPFLKLEGRFQINPEPLKVRGEIPKVDADAGRCEAMLQDGSGRCLYDAKWSVLASEREWVLCGVHARAARNWPNTAAMEPLDD